MDYIINFAYDGTTYNGYASQKHKNTIQDELEKCLKKIFKENIKTLAASRTDTGVHAMDQWAIFSTKQVIEPKRLINALNGILNDAIIIKNCLENTTNFHPRYNCRSKTYHYIIAKEKTPFNVNYTYYSYKSLNIVKMQQACKYFIGKHDFTSCCSSNTHIVDKVRTINTLIITENKNEIIIKINGNGFLYNMVRIIVGNLIAVGVGEIKPEDISIILKKRDRCASYSTAIPNGLYLMKINY